MATRWQRIGGGIIATACLTAVAWWCIGPEAGLGRWLARSWARGLSHGSAEQVAGDMRCIAALDGVGLDALLDALGSSRPVVTEAAAEALRERMQVWRQWPPEKSGPLAEQLARSLAERLGGWPVASQRVAADVALELLSWPRAAQQDTQPAVLVHCERILRSVPAIAPSQYGQAGEEERKTTRTEAEPQSNQPGLLSSSRSAADAAEYPLAASALSDVPGVGPEIQPANTQQTDSPAVAVSESSPGVLAPWRSDVAPPRTPIESTATETSQTIPPSPDDAPSLADVPILDLFVDLHNADSGIQEQVKAELKRRGFRDYELHLAAKLSDPDPAVRRQVAHLVHGLSSGAGRWLVWLSYDPDRSVRQAAVSLMVTAQDPLVKQRLLKMEVTDADTAICERIREWRERR